MAQNTITGRDILKGMLFILIVFPAGYLLYLAIRMGIFEGFWFIIENISNKFILGAILILVVIIGAIISTLSTAVEFGLPLHDLFKKNNKQKN